MVVMEPQNCCVSGLNLAIFCRENVFNIKSNKLFSVVFVTHGRGGKVADIYSLCQGIVERAAKEEDLPLIAIGLEQRNHGSRLVDPSCNRGWSTQHATDMYGIMLGTSRDISSVLDLLPAKLKIQISGVAVAGISLGGHASLLTMALDNRFNVCCSLLGCPDFTSLMKQRARSNGVNPDSFGDYYPEGLEKLVKRTDPINNIDSFVNKKAMLLCGASDTLVPASCSYDFVAKVSEKNVGTEFGHIGLTEYPKIEHKVTPQMAKDAADFLVTSLSLYHLKPMVQSR